ncbi:MAG TPA: four helix bundle protein [Candidatus Hydrogenedentes bacterium]|nr:four helix bundle protein [Candidatus Hydrogenedentota bacterium]HRT18641.1 four helix bundle protein [Candidatus Hydrogenedentota bacterium]HRT63661.1 four helix bundle protein [Candidatus Hydrogenedentota bacterium]
MSADDANSRSYRTDERNKKVKRGSLRFCGFLQFFWTAMFQFDRYRRIERAKNPRRGNVAQSFEERHVYQHARTLTNAIYTLTRREDFLRDSGLVAQSRRVSVSIMSNIAEGFGRGAKTEFIRFFFIAKGSCGEVRAQSAIAHNRQYIEDTDYIRLLNLARRVSGMLSNFLAHLQGSDYQGEKFKRPQRIAADTVQKRVEALRAAQEANINAVKENEKKRRTQTFSPSHPSNVQIPQFSSRSLATSTEVRQASRSTKKKDFPEEKDCCPSSPGGGDVAP